MKPAMSERNKKIVELRYSGKSFVEIGKMFSISSERASQIFHKITDVRDDDLEMDKAKKAKKEVEIISDHKMEESDVYKFLMKQPGATPKICKRIYEILWEIKDPDKRDDTCPTFKDIQLTSPRSIGMYKNAGSKLISVYYHARENVNKNLRNGRSVVGW